MKLLVSLAISALLAAQIQSAQASMFDENRGPVTLTILHNNDGESALLSESTFRTEKGNLVYGGAATFATVMRREIKSARALGNATLSVYAGDSFLASKALICSNPADNNSTAIVLDGVAQSQMPYDVHVLGNHEFDYGTGFLRRYIQSFSSKTRHPFISGNLDFSQNSDLAELQSRKPVVLRGIHNGKVIGQSYVHKDYTTGALFGVVSAITPTLRTISSPGTVKLTSIDIAETAKILNKQVADLQASGLNKIILVSHLQGVAFDRQLISLLKGVDIAIAGGGDDLLVSPDVAQATQLIPGEAAPVGKYPEMVKDAAGIDVPLITTKGNYAYLGRFDVSFSAGGAITSYNKSLSYPRRVIPQSTIATALGVSDAVKPDSKIVASVDKPLNDCLSKFAVPIASSKVVFATDRGSATTLGVRTAETNGGNLVADSFIHAYRNRASGFNLPADSAANPLVAVQNGGGIRQNGGVTLPVNGLAGSINRGNTFDLLPFDNRLVAITGVTAADLKEVFERSCAISTAGGGQFLQIAGMKVTCARTGTAIVISNPTGDSYAGTVTTPGTRVQNITLNDGRVLVQNGSALATAPRVTIITNSFTADGGDNYPTLAKLIKVGFGVSYEQALYDYLLSFPKNSAGLPEVSDSDTRYAKSTGEGRFTWLP